MKGARAEPWVSTINDPKSARTMMIGASHHFLRTRRKSQNSLAREGTPERGGMMVAIVAGGSERSQDRLRAAMRPARRLKRPSGLRTCPYGAEYGRFQGGRDHPMPL